MDSIEFYIVAHACGKVRIKESEGSIEERIVLLKRMRDGHAWETIKANFHMACKETVGRRKEAEEERGADLLQPFDEEILAEVKNRRGQTLTMIRPLMTPTLWGIRRRPRLSSLGQS